jgi:uncharacterized protein
MKVFRKSLTVLICLLFSLSLIAQEKIDYSPSFDIVVKAYEYKLDGEYEKAVEEFEKVHESDSLFFKYALSEKMACYANLEEYEKVKDLGDKYWFFRHKLPTEFYLAYGSALDKLEEFEQAQKMYVNILEEYPMNYSLWYNYAISLSLAEKYEEAYEAYKHTVMVNPLYDRVHIALALYALREKQTTKAVMALSMYLFLSQEKRNNFDQLQFADEVVQNKYWTYEEIGETTGLDLEGNDEFSTIDQLLHNYVALDKKYKTKSKLNYPFVKQSHLVFSQLEEIKVDEDDFWHVTYVDFFQQMMKEGMFPGFTYSISTHIEVPSISSKVKKKATDLQRFQSWAVNYIDEKNKYVDFGFMGLGKQRVEREGEYFYVSLMGDYEYDEVSEILSGDLAVYDAEGRKTAEGSFNEDGFREGEWRDYHSNGYLSEIVNYDEKGKAVDTSYVYFDNGLLQYKVIYNDGKFDGDICVYEDGILDRVIPFTMGEMKGGIYRYYYPIDTLYYSYNLKEGKADGLYEAFYDSGEQYMEGSYKEGDYDGELIEYYRNGNVSVESNYIEGEKEGDYVEFYKDGQMKEEGSYTEGKQIGEWKSYYPDGTIESIINLDETGKENGLVQNYTRNGWKISELNYKKGEIVGYKFFDKDGEILSEDVRKGGDFYYKGYYSNGSLWMEGTYGKKEKDGIWKTYYIDGSLKIEEEYDKGKSIGKYKQHFPNGQLEILYSFDEEGDATDYYEEYYCDGKMYSQGYLNHGNYDGPWEHYFRDGSIRIKEFYIDGKREGSRTEYTVNNVIQNESYYEDDLLKFTIYYDTLGLAFDTVFETVGKRKLEVRSCENCPLYLEVDVYNNRFHGSKKWYYPNGEIYAIGETFNGPQHGKWKGYHPNGQLYYEGSYEYGDNVGVWKYYNLEGILTGVYNYKDDEYHGIYEQYDDEGNIRNRINYEEGFLNGDAYYFIGGKQDHIRVYEYDRLVAIKYTKGGKEIVQEIDNESAEVEIYWNNGKLARKFTISNDWYEGEYLMYYQNGQLAYKANYVNGRIEGDIVKYYPNGKILLECPYVDDDEEGVKKQYFSNGNIKEKTTYVKGEKSGKRILYDNKGNIKLEINYYDGVPISMK